MTQISENAVLVDDKKNLRRIRVRGRHTYIVKGSRRKNTDDKKTGKNFKTSAKRRAPSYFGWSRKQIFAEKCRLVYVLNDPKIGEGRAVLPGVQLPSKSTHTGSSTPMHTAVSGLVWQAYDRFAQICRMDGSDLVLGKMAVALAPIFDADALAYLAEFDDRAAQIPGRVKRAINSAMIGKSAFKAHHSRVDVARGRVVKRIVWWFINDAIRTPANAPLLGETGTVATSNKMGFIADDLFAILLPEFKKAWAKKNGKSTQESAQQSTKGKAGKPQREKKYKPRKGSGAKRMEIVKEVIVALAAARGDD